MISVVTTQLRSCSMEVVMDDTYTGACGLHLGKILLTKPGGGLDRPTGHHLPAAALDPRTQATGLRDSNLIGKIAVVFQLTELMCVTFSIHSQDFTVFVYNKFLVRKRRILPYWLLWVLI